MHDGATKSDGKAAYGVMLLPVILAPTKMLPAKIWATLISVTLCTVLTLVATSAQAQQDNTKDNEPAVVQPDTSQPDTVQTPAFAAFWQRFRTALKANDRGQLQAMTHLPFDYDGKSYDRAQFAALAGQLYDAKIRHCLLTETPLHDQEVYEVFCGEIVYVFGTDPGLPPGAATIPDGSAWRLIELGAND